MGRQKLVDQIDKVGQKTNKINKTALCIQRRFRQNKRKKTPIEISNQPRITSKQPNY